MRKVYVDIKSRIIVNMDDGVDLNDVISEMNYNFVSGTEGADIEDSEIVDYEVTDSK